MIASTRSRRRMALAGSCRKTTLAHRFRQLLARRQRDMTLAVAWDHCECRGVGAHGLAVMLLT